MLVITRIFFIVLFSFCCVSTANASLLYPTVQDASILQGDEFEFEIAVKNESIENRIYDIEFIGVELGVEVGEYNFFELSQDQLSWFDTEVQNFELVSDEVRSIKITVSPSLFIDSQTFIAGVQVVEGGVDQSNIDVKTGFVTLVFLTIGDGILEDVKLLNYELDRDVSLGHVQVFYTIRNLGDRIAQPLGQISLISWNGRIIDTFQINPNKKRVAGGQDRTFIIDINDEWAFGPYEVRLDSQYWANGEVHSTSVTLWFFSLKTGALLVIGFIFLFIGLRYAKRD